MVKKISAVLTALIALTTNNVYAEKDIQWYDVEIILFRQLSSEGIDNETWNQELLQPDTAECVDIGFGHQIETTEQTMDEEAEETTITKATAPFFTIPKSELRLNNEAAAIARSKGQRVLAHIGWRQPGYDQNNAIPVRINAGPLLLAKPLPQDDPESLSTSSLSIAEGSAQEAEKSSNGLYADSTASETTTEETEIQSNTNASSIQNATITPLTDTKQVIDIEITGAQEQPQQQVVATSKVNGCITIFRERYLHILTDLVYYHEDNEDIYAEENESYSFGKPVYATAVPLKTRRRMRSKELHYLDSPGVGVVVLVTPYDFKTSSEEESE